MSTRFTLCALGVVGLAITANTGCYYDQLLQEQRARRTLEEKVGGLQTSLHDQESMNQVLGAKNAAMEGQLAAKDQTIGSLSAENESLRSKWDKAMTALEAAAKQPLNPLPIITQMLPPELNKALKDWAAKHPNEVEFLEDQGVVRWKSDLLFDLGSAKLQDSSASPLGEFADIIKSSSANGFDIVIVGHTCNTPIRKAATLAEHKTNWHLSVHRAIAVKDALEHFGIADERMGVMGYGEYRPIVENTTEANKAKNRRVEIYIVPASQIASVGSSRMASPPAKPAPGADVEAGG